MQHSLRNVLRVFKKGNGIVKIFPQVVDDLRLFRNLLIKLF